MVKIRLAYAFSLASLAAGLLGSVSLPKFAWAQSAAVTNSNAATADTATANTSNRSRGPVDPGVRGGDPGAGGPLAGLSAVELAFFGVAKEVFQEVEQVADGLGPRFNL